ncbi:MAG: class I adenylate-forming enzyme family protein [Alphaproteobacteria bacterium]
MTDIETVRARHRALMKENRAFMSEPLPANIGTLVDEAAARHGDAPALVFFEAGETLTYRALKDQMDRCAGAFARLGIGKGTRVVVMLPNMPAYPVTWLALARLGAIMVPVNTRYTARELEYVINDAEAQALVIHSDYVPHFESIGRRPASLTSERVITVGQPCPGFKNRWPDLVAAAGPDFRPSWPVGLDDLVNIQYTSGTTGFPKGCMIPQCFWLQAARVAGFVTRQRFKRILVAQFFFYMDPMFLLPLALLQGGAVYMCSRPNNTKFMEWVRAYEIELCLIFEPVYKQPPHPDDAKTKLKNAFIFGFTKENHHDLERRFSVTAREFYGMTENGGCLYVPPEDTHMVGSGSCGIPAPGREVKIMGEDGLPVPPGEVGELWTRGLGQMHGYYDKPEANAESLRGEWFRTGDLFRVDMEGYHYIVGRVKDMVRRSGENIASREVEAVLRTMPEIKEAAVVPVPDSVRGEEVKAYIQLQDGIKRSDVPPERILAHCEAGLARFKIPRYIAYRDSFSYTASDRVEKKKLTEGIADLRADSYDRVDKVWR